MPDPVDVYSDQLGLNTGPIGCALNFAASAALPPAGGGVVPGLHVATVRMSLEHAKTMAFILQRQLLQYERGSGVEFPIPQNVLNQLRVGREDWNAFWGGRCRA